MRYQDDWTKEIGADGLTFSDRLADLIKKRGTAKQVAHDTGIPESALSNYQNSDCKRVPSSEVIFKLARYFGVSADWLLGLSEYQSVIAGKQSAETLGLPESLVRYLMFIRRSSALNEYELIRLLFDSESFRYTLQTVARLARYDYPEEDHPSGIEGCRLSDYSWDLADQVEEKTNGQYTVCDVYSAIQGELFLAQSDFVDAIKKAFQKFKLLPPPEIIGYASESTV